MNFVIHCNETALSLHVFPIPIPPPTSLSTCSLLEWMKSSFQFRFFKWVIWTEEKGHQNLQRLKWNEKVAFMIGRPRGQLHCHRIMRCSDWEKVKRQIIQPLHFIKEEKKKSRPGKFKWLGLTHSTNWYQDVACGFLGLCPSANQLICVTKSRYGVTLY